MPSPSVTLDVLFFFFFQAEDGIRDADVTGVQTCALPISHTSYLQNETQEIKFYRFMPITNLGFMIRDVELSDDLTLTNIEYVDFTSDYDFEVEEISTGSYKVKVISNDVADFELGIVFINEFDGQYTLVGALKNPIINGNVLEFYVTTTMAGLKPNPRMNIEALFDVFGDLELGTSSHVELLGDINFEMDYQYYPSKRVDSTFDVFGDLELGTSSHVELLGDINFEMDYQYYPSKRVDSTFDVFGDLELGTSSHVQLIGNVNFEMNGEAKPSENIYAGLLVTGDLQVSSSNLSLLGDVEFIVDATIDTRQRQLLTPNIGATASCLTYGTVSNPTYTFGIAVTNTESVQVRMYVSIDGVWQNRLMNGNTTYIFTRSKSSPWGVETVQAYATATGYEDSETRTVTRSVSCPVPDPDPQGLTWQYNGQSSQPICVPAGYNPIGTSCSVSGQTMAVSGEDIGYPSGCYELICKK